jgi:hypothetical protein
VALDETVTEGDCDGVGDTDDVTDAVIVTLPVADGEDDIDAEVLHVQLSLPVADGEAVEDDDREGDRVRVGVAEAVSDDVTVAESETDGEGLVDTVTVMDRVVVAVCVGSQYCVKYT